MRLFQIISILRLTPTLHRLKTTFLQLLKTSALLIAKTLKGKLQFSFLKQYPLQPLWGVTQENAFGTLHLRPCFLIFMKTLTRNSTRNSNILILKVQILLFILRLWLKLQLKLQTLTPLKLLLFLR